MGQPEAPAITTHWPAAWGVSVVFHVLPSLGFCALLLVSLQANEAPASIQLMPACLPYSV